MAAKPTYKELEQRIREFEQGAEKHAEASKKNEEKYRNIFNNAQVGIFRTRLSDGKVLECNDRFAGHMVIKTLRSV